MLLTGGVVSLITCAAFFAYELFTFRQTTFLHVSTLAEIVGNNSTAALAFESEEDAFEILSALKAEPHIRAAGLYDEAGKLFAYYPSDLDTLNLPGSPGNDGYVFTASNLTGFQKVMQGQRQLGTLYLNLDTDALYDRLKLYAIIVSLIILASFIVAYSISERLQRGISNPIRALAETAKAISDKRDYTVRAARQGNDEVGSLTDAFNQMLSEIQLQNQALLAGESRVRAVLNSAITAVIVMDKDGLVTDWNQQAEKIFGWSREEATGQLMADMIIPLYYRDAHKAGMKLMLETGNSKILGQVLELSALRRDGTEFPVELSVNVLNNNDVLSFCGFVTDISERKKAQEELKLFSQNLEQIVSDRTLELEMANKEMESFSYSISHDLRAPLRSIHGYVSIFLEDYGEQFDDEAKRLMGIISSNTNRMGQLIDDLLEFSKLGRKDIQKTEIEVERLVRQVVEYALEDVTKAVEVHVENLPRVRADQSLLEQVWTNLISNGIKYSSKKEKPRVDIRCRKEGGEFVFSVQDNGAGFSMDYAHKLFGVFQRLHKTTEFEGTGVGLAIVQRIVQKHGGRVWAEGKVDEGSTFYFTLPENG